MMTYIRQLPSGRWQAALRRPGGRRAAKIDESREAVEQWAADYDPTMPDDNMPPGHGQPVDALTGLVLQRLAELGEPGQPLTIREAAHRSGGKLSHETLMRIAKGEHTGQLTDSATEGLAEALGVPVATVRATAT